jgi:hypothetical protein
MMRKQVALPLAEWLAKAEGSGCAELRGFAAGLRLDVAAVTAARMVGGVVGKFRV